MRLDYFIIRRDKRKKPYNIKNKALPHCKKCGKFLQKNRKYETWCSWCESFVETLPSV